MKTALILLLCMAFTIPAFAQQGKVTQRKTIRPEKIIYATSTMDNQLAVGVTPVDTLNNTDTLILANALSQRFANGSTFHFTARLANSMDSIKFQQYDLNGDTWVDLPVTFKAQGPILANGSAWQRIAGVDDTTATWFSSLGNNNTAITYDMSVPNRTGGDIRSIRVPNDTGTVKMTYVLPTAR